VHAADEADANRAGAASFADAHSRGSAGFSQVLFGRRCAQIVSVVLLAEHHRLLDLVRVQVTRRPDDIAVAASEIRFCVPRRPSF
jgi:hypothetical protein